MSQLKETCNLLDDTLLEYFETLEAVHQKQEELDCCMKDGFLLMAKARYNMGAKSVGALQYDTDNMEAASVVKISDDDEIEAIYPVFSLQPNEQEKQKENTRAEGDGLRKRMKNKDEEIDQLAESIQEIGLKEHSDDQLISKAGMSPKKKDALRWFGVLVPQTLKDSQSKFKQAVALSCDLATLKVKLNSLQSHYNQLMQEKRDILNSVSLFTD